MHDKRPPRGSKSLSKLWANVHTSRVWSFLISISLVTPFALAGIYLLVAIWGTLNEDQEVVFFFFGVPAYIGGSFLTITALQRQLHRSLFPRYLLLTGALLACVLAVPIQLMIASVSSFFFLAEQTTVWIIIIGAWLSTILISALLFAMLLQHRYRHVVI